jgi:hypothetical protein
MASPELAQRLSEIITTFPDQPDQVLEERLRPLADGGDIRALTLYAVLRIQHGDNIDAALPYARRAVEQGAGWLAQVIANDLINRGRPELRAEAPFFIDAATTGGWPFLDLRSGLWNAVNQRDVALTMSLLDAATTGPPPAALAARWDEALAKVDVDVARISDAASAVEGQREVALQQIGEQIDAARSEGATISRLADDLGVLAHEAGSISLARAYAERAEQEETRASRYTNAWLALAAGSVAAAALIALLTLNESASIATAAQRAAFATPLALFAAVISRLAHSYRLQAWKLRHVELQIQTSNPFLATLDERDRNRVYSELALRFFPGQQADANTSADHVASPVASQPLTMDPTELVTAIARALETRTPPAAASSRPEAP